MKVYIDPACNILYSSFYIIGIKEYYGKNNVHFSNKEYFKDFSFNNQFFSFVTQDHNNIKKVIIDFADSSDINQKALRWCDVYGKINLAEEDFNLSKKIIPIGPSFGVKIYSLFDTLTFSVLNYLKSYNRIGNKRLFFSNYKSQFKRIKLKDYSFKINKENYIYFIATLWKKEEKTNTERANFIKACKTSNLVNFEGGFAPRSRDDMPDFKYLTLSTRVTMKDYLLKINKSAIAFNTPAVLDCHGWKLAEFLCLGKVIVSTKLSRKLPKPLLNNEDFLITDGTKDDLQNKIEYILKNESVRIKMQENARKYFNNELAPKSVIKRLDNSLQKLPL
ncbi:MAG: hypothetical protein V3V28_13480 [Polaribacter sp.]|uniref:glycosyltransferase n=1 Tax=Polaribacter sp. TaxID=1920175 RepID=UPI002F35CD06